MTVQLVQTDSGVVLPVKAQPGAKKNAITGDHDGALKVSVTQAPENGKANRALTKVIAHELGLRNSQIRLASGITSSSKSFVITDVAISELRDRIQVRLQR